MMRLIILLTITWTFSALDISSFRTKIWKLNTWSECQLTTETIRTSIEEIIKYKLVAEQDTLIARIDFQCRGLRNLDRIETDERIVLLNNSNKSKKKADILLTSFQKDQEGLIIKFKTFAGDSEEIFGTIEFECVADKYAVKDFYFLRGVD